MSKCQHHSRKESHPRRISKVFNNLHYINRKIHAAGGIEATVPKTAEAGRAAEQAMREHRKGARAMADVRLRDGGQGP
jgi:hypothetical protein